VIVDFSSLKEGDEVVLLNLGPDEPYKGPSVSPPQAPADPKTTGQVMKLRVVKLTGQGKLGAIPATLPPVASLSTTLPRGTSPCTRRWTTWRTSRSPPAGDAHPRPQGWSAPVTESIKLGDTEIWRVINLTADAHPIHLHLTTFQVLDRRPFNESAYGDALETYLEAGGTVPKIDDHFTAAAQPAQPWEKGYKDTVIANPGEVVRFIAKFDLPGVYVWHCHISSTRTTR